MTLDRDDIKAIVADIIVDKYGNDYKGKLKFNTAVELAVRILDYKLAFDYSEEISDKEFDELYYSLYSWV